MYPFYHITTFLMKGLLRLLSDWRVMGRDRVPSQGGLIVVANHLNNADPPLLSASIPRRIVFMAKEEIYYAASIQGLLTRGFGAFPVRRGAADRQALQRAVQAVRAGLVLGMFPEGTRSPTSQLQPAQQGASWVALKTGAPILPVGITGTEGIKGIKGVLGRPAITVNIGQPFRLELPPRINTENLAQATDNIMEKIAELLPPSYRGAYGRKRPAAGASAMEHRKG